MFVCLNGSIGTLDLGLDFFIPILYFSFSFLFLFGSWGSALVQFSL